MTKRRTRVLALAAALTAATFTGSSFTFGQQRPQTATPGDTALAARFAELARDELRPQSLTPNHFLASAALLEGANRLDPADPRCPRLQADVRQRAGDADGMAAALKEWLKATPSNVWAQTQLVDLYVSRMESADAKLSYLRELIGKPPVGDQVRSHAAALATKLLFDRGETEQARKTLDESLRLNPLNIDALRLRVQLAGQPGATPAERASAFVALLRANPIQPPVVAALAQQAASMGLARESLEWFNLGGLLSSRTGQPPQPSFITGYVSELFIANQNEAAQKVADQVVTANPSAVEIWLIKLAMEKSAGSKTIDDTKRKTGTALSNRLADVRKAAGQKSATTRPVDTGPGLEVPDFTADLKDLKARVDASQLRDAYLSVLSDIAWYQNYFLDQPAAPGVLEFMRQTLPADNPILSRVEGWSALAQGKTDEARVKLSAVADRDPLSKLGMLRLASKDAQANPAADARKLVNDNPAGVIGAILWGALKDYKGVELVRSPQAETVAAELAKFPRDLLKIIDTPQEFYAIRGNPLQISHQFAEPLMADVTIQNMSDFDLTVGPDGVLRPDLWFDARLRGGVDQQVPGVTYDRIAEQGVLHARQSITQRVRLDEGVLGQALSRNPAVSVQVYAGVMTNPQAVQNGLVPGPAGYRVQFPRVMERVATQLGPEPQRQQWYNRIANGDGAEKIRTMELLATFCQMIRNTKDVNKDALAVADEMTNAVRNAMSDGEASVQSWAAYSSALAGPADRLPDAVRQMSTDKAWQKRLLALTILPALSAEQRRQLPDNIGQDDADPVVRSYAKAAAEVAKTAATQPAPSTQPAVPSATGANKP